MIKIADILAEMFPPYKASMVSKVRYKASDTTTNDPKVATKRGYLENDVDNLEGEKQVKLNEKCWRGYTQKGMKTMFGKKYPNCVKIKK